VRQAAKDTKALPDNIIGSFASDIADKTHPAGIVLKTPVIQAIFFKFFSFVHSAIILDIKIQIELAPRRTYGDTLRPDNCFF
jgi:hypothetical protein